MQAQTVQDLLRGALRQVPDPRSAPARDPRTVPARPAQDYLDCGRFTRLVDAIYATPLPGGAAPAGIQGLSAAIMRGSEDDVFVPIFGKPFDQMTPRELLVLRNYGERCMRDHVAEYRDAMYKMSVVTQLLDPDTRDGKVRRLVAARGGAADSTGFLAELPTLPATDAGLARLDDIAAASKKALANAMPSQSAAFDTAFRDARARIVPAVEGRQVADALAQPPSVATLRDTSALATRLETRQRDETLDSARSARAQEIAAVKARMAWLETEQARAESAAYRAAMAPTGGLDALADAQLREQRLANDYGDHLRAPAFEQFGRERFAYRRELAAQNAARLKARFDAVDRLVDLDALADTWATRPELAADPGNAVAVAYRSRRTQVAPFSSLSGGDYLDAIYAGDDELMARLDRQYVAPFRPTLESMRRSSPPALVALVPDADRMSMIGPVLSKYLFGYDSYFGSCLRKDAVAFTETRRVDTVQRNGYGVEVARFYGVPNHTTYRVNREFAPALNELGASDGNNNLMLFDLFANKGQITSLLTGVDQLLGSFACNDPRIGRFERNLLRYYTARN